METFHNQLIKVISEMEEANPVECRDIDIENIISEITPEIVASLKKSLQKTTGQMLWERRRLSTQFEARNLERWREGFDLLETHIVICTEAGEEFNKSYRPEAVENNDLVLDVVVRQHARACHIAQEILCLLKSGFPDAAHARWRALHEVNCTAMFIVKQGQDCAERFYFHDVVDSYDAMREHKKYENRLQEKGPSQAEIDDCKKEYDELIRRYGKSFSQLYGWAAHIFPSHQRVGFAAIEKNVGLDHMRPYYKWASQNIHASSKGMTSRLGLCEARHDILLVGQSNSGMTDPAHATAISLYQITTTLLCLKPALDHIVMCKIAGEYEQAVGDTFLRISQSKS
ncbi:DUF5677 domain-containing protein [Kushneria konosiri]|uniref:Uncharacterized protein n=1 Tax=Kushneria konosiri TaxID=698828 RepID=A0A2Z2HGG5_9GAMM|nr:DUF5677 domain-containing protein [Kushneria konosiri]ARS52301.1 hypothetical protein B9G99_04910 [Kushneria konosiri]